MIYAQCPKCWTVAMPLGPTAPVAGDAIVCHHCVALLIYFASSRGDGALLLRELEDVDARALSPGTTGALLAAATYIQHRNARDRA